MMYTRPPRLEALLMEQEIDRRRASGFLLNQSGQSGPSIEDRPTQITGAIQPVKPVVFSTQPLRLQGDQIELPQDSQGRPYLQVNNPYESTYNLVDALFERYYALTRTYRVAIVLSAFRYLTDGIRMEYYYPRRPGVPRIPFEYEGAVHYDVLCRGERVSV